MVSPAEAPSVVLSFGGQQAELTPAAGGIEELQERAEADFGLVPGSYNFFDVCGKVEGAALQRALRFAGEGPCMIDVREKPEWQKMRELEARIEEVAAQQQQQQQQQQQPIIAGPAPVPEEAARVAEERMMARVGAALAELGGGLERAEAKVNGVLAPFLETIACSQMEMKAKLDSIDVAALTTRIDGLESTLAAARALTREPIGLQSLRGIPACKLDMMTDQDPPPASPSRRSPAGSSGKLGRGGSDGAGRQPQWQEGGGLSEFTFSGKSWHRGAGQRAGDADGRGEPSTASFVRCVVPRQLDRKPLSRSTPLLPPVF